MGAVGLAMGSRALAALADYVCEERGARSICGGFINSSFSVRRSIRFRAFVMS